MKKVTSRTKLRLKAIALVNSYASVLTEDEFVSAMGNASSLFADREGSDDLHQAVFGSNAENILEKYEVILFCDDTLLNITIPEFYRLVLVQQLRERKMTIADARAAIDHMQGDDPVTRKNELDQASMEV